jgi:1-acyl-sn-glycerol-3-phosphate acyltransferase
MNPTSVSTSPEQRRFFPDVGPWVSGVSLASVRAAGFAAIIFLALIELAWLGARGMTRQSIVRALWLQRICRRLVRLLGIHASYRGEVAESGVLVFNHVSYLDVVVLAARHPLLFVAKKELRSWPVIGWLVARAGTIFIDRTRRADVARVCALMTEAITEGVRVCIFPEGTSGDGSRVLPFRTSLLETVVAGAWPVTAGWVGYSVEDGRASQDVCYWGEMNFATHFPRLLTKRRIFARVACVALAAGRMNRKELGHELHALVSSLSAQHA